MSKAIEKYIDQVMVFANPSEADEPKLRAELEDHLYTKATELEEKGVSREDAIFQAIDEQGAADRVGYGLRKFRWVDVRAKGTARGVIAIGPKAVGVVAFGGAAFGVFAFGGFSAGLISFGGFSLGLLFSWGGVSASLFLALGGVALGLFALGGFAAGVFSLGGYSCGLFGDQMLGQGISLWPMSDAPKWVQGVMARETVMTLFPIFNIGALVFWFVVFGVMMALQQREVRRVRKADRRLVE